VTASSCKLQPCRKSNSAYASFRPSTATSRWLPVKWRDIRVTTAHLRSRDIISCHVTASSCDLQPCRKSNTVYVSFRPSTATSRWLPVKWRHFQVTSGHLRSRDDLPVMWLPPFASYNLVGSQTQHTLVFGLLQPLPGDFRSNDVTSGSHPVSWGYVTSFPVTWLPLPANYSLVGSQMHSIRELSAFCSHFQVTSGLMTSLRVTTAHLRSRDIIFCDVTASSCELQPCRKWNTAYNSFRLSTATSRWLRSNDVTSGHLRSRDIIPCHVTDSCELQPCRK